MVSFLHRVAAVSHVERLTLSTACWFQYDDPLEMDNTGSIAEALVRTIQGNPTLEYLKLSNVHWLAGHFHSIFQALEQHQGIRTLMIFEYSLVDRSEDTAYSWLQQLLTRNRDIVVVDSSGKRITDGSRIKELYALNDFWKGSVQLWNESSAESSAKLFATAVTEIASENFVYTTLILCQHADTLCEFIETALKF
jgi:hypothetical protein